MTDFFTRLAERTQGLTPRVEPLLAPHYAPAAAVTTFGDPIPEEQSVPTQVDPLQPVPRSHADATFTPESGLPRNVAETDSIPGATESVVNAPQSSDGETNVAGRPVASSMTGTRVPPENASRDDLPVSTSEQTAARDTRQPLLPRADADAQPSNLSTAFNTLSSESNAVPAATSPPVRQGERVQAPSPAGPGRQGETDAIAPANPSTQHQQAARAETSQTRLPQTGPLVLSPVLPVNPATTGGGNGLFDRPVVEPAAWRDDVGRPLPVALAGQRESNPSANESVPPVVQVTIGRVEVRAMLPPTPATEQPAPARTRPVLSLDEYLQQRSGGNR